MGTGDMGGGGHVVGEGGEMLIKPNIVPQSITY